MSEAMLPLLQAYLPAAFTDRARVEITGLRSLNTGWESEVYAFDAALDGHTVPLILRIYSGGDTEQKAVREFHTLEELRKAGYPVPRVDRLETSRSPFGSPFLIMERVPGRSMWRPMFHGTLEEQARLRDLFCNLLARLHALDPRPFDADFDPAQNPVQRQLARWQAFVDTNPLPGFQPGWEWIARYAPEISQGTSSPCHWDFHPENILMDEDGSAVVIDWTGLEVTDRRFDVAWTLLLITSSEGEATRSPLLRGYECAAGITLADMEFFEAVACFRRLFSVLVSLAMGAEKMGMRSGAEKMMRAQSRALRFVYERWLALTRVPISDAEAFFQSLTL